MMIADEVDLPQILYNVPSRTGCDLLNETVLRLVDHENIVGLKDATGDLARLKDIINKLTPKQEGAFSLFSGDDPTATEFIINGGVGTISVTANIAPKLSFGNPSINKALLFIDGKLLKISDASIKVSTVPGFLICFKMFFTVFTFEFMVPMKLYHMILHGISSCEHFFTLKTLNCGFCVQGFVHFQTFWV